MSDIYLELIWLLVGLALLSGSIVGLLRGGDLPLLPTPRSLRPAMQVIFAFVLIVSMTVVLEVGKPDFFGRLIGI